MPQKMKAVAENTQHLFSDYQLFERSYDEYFSEPGQSRDSLADIIHMVQALSLKDLNILNLKAKKSFKERGITFKVYSKANVVKEVFPFDLLPRMISSVEWQKIERGLTQRIKALNAFLNDIYGSQNIIKDGIIPESIINSCEEFLPTLRGIIPLGQVPINIAGCDLIRNTDGEFYVLEDNLRVPSGVSYLMENRKVMKELLPEWMQGLNICEVENYPQKLKAALHSLMQNEEQPLLVVLTPGIYNSAYFEHRYLAEQMQCPLVENSDLFVKNQQVFWRSSSGAQKVAVIYRRIDDQYMDPNFFRADSLLGIPGIMDAYAAGQVVLANAPGNGVADDKAIYHFVPAMIRYYLNESIILPQIPTWLAADKQDCDYILSNLKDLVIKMVNQSGGYGMLIGPQATRLQLKEFREKIQRLPRAYVAQPLIELSTAPALSRQHLRPHRVDLRVFVVSGNNGTWVLPGALTRVALKKRSYIVNSSQGGGSKDTWVMHEA